MCVDSPRASQPVSARKSDSRPTSQSTRSRFREDPQAKDTDVEAVGRALGWR